MEEKLSYGMELEMDSLIVATFYNDDRVTLCHVHAL